LAVERFTARIHPKDIDDPVAFGTSYPAEWMNYWDRLTAGFWEWNFSIDLFQTISSRIVLADGSSFLKE
jgi:hypothetical protein